MIQLIYYMSKNPLEKNSTAQFLIFNAENTEFHIEVRVEEETIWLTQKLIAELFVVDTRTISEHLQNIFKTNELKKDSTIRNFRIVQIEGSREVSRDVEHYNLDAIIAVGYRVNSKRATSFRIWATGVLREFIIKGFAIDDKRLEQGKKFFSQDYFKELLERVRSIRASERRIYQQISDIFAECSIDYDATSLESHDFYAMVQNKFHFAITGKTAPEIIYESADKDLPHMGLSTWKNSPNGRVLKSDVVVAKNYLSETDIKKLERTITGFFDYIEGLVDRKNIFTMKEFAQSVDKFLSFNEYKILESKGNISKKVADEKAMSEYNEFNKHQIVRSDFDKKVEELLKSEA